MIYSERHQSVLEEYRYKSLGSLELLLTMLYDDELGSSLLQFDFKQHCCLMLRLL